MVAVITKVMIDLCFDKMTEMKYANFVFEQYMKTKC